MNNGHVWLLQRWFARLLLPVVGVLAVACAGAASQRSTSTIPRPQDAVHAYAEALQQRRWKDAYALLSERMQQQIAYDQFVELVRESPEQVHALIVELTRPSGRWEMQTVLTMPSGEKIRLVQQDGRWRVDGSSVFLFSQSTPEAALRSFVRAFELKRYDVLLRFVPRDERQGLDASKLRAAWEGADHDDIAAWVATVRSLLQKPDPGIRVVGNRARLSLGTNKTAELVFEDGSWRISRFE